MAIVCTSVIEHVTVYARGAVVTRSLTLPEVLPDGPVELEIPGVTALAEPTSLRASLEGGRSLLSVRAPIVVPPGDSPTSAAPEQLRELTLRLERLNAEQQVLDEHRRRLLHVRPTPNPESALGVARFDALARGAAGAGKLIDDVVARLDARLFELEEQIREQSKKRDAAELALRQASGPQRKGPPSRTLFLRLIGAGKVTRAEVSYIVAPARWWPLYALRVSDGGRAAVLQVEALVAQMSGEDWGGVRLSFAAADLIHDARLPELPSLRLGRAQPPVRTGYRPPPPGLDPLFAGLDRQFPELTPPAPIPEDERPGVNYTLRDLLVPGFVTRPHGRADADRRTDEEKARLDAMRQAEIERARAEIAARARMEEQEVRREHVPAKKTQIDLRTRLPGKSAVEADRGGAPPPPAARASSSMPAAPPAGKAEGGGGGRAEPEPGALEPSERYADFSRLRLGSPMDRHRRGRLQVVPNDAPSLEAMQRIEAASPQQEVHDPRSSRGQFAHRYDAAARGAVPSDAVPHLVPVMSAPTPLRTSFRAVPRELPDVFREASFANPFDAPLLAGPVQVYVDGSLLTTAEIDRVGKGGQMRVGLGIEPRLRAARNSSAVEGTSGLLSGSAVVTHTVRIELASSLGYPAEIEVLDRIPIADDKQIVIEKVSASPEPRPYDQSDRGRPVRGGLRWQVTLPAAASISMEFQYRVTFSAKYELTGGNRRE